MLFTCIKSWFFRNHSQFHQISHWSCCCNVIDSLFKWLCFIDCQAHIFFFKTKNCSNDDLFIGCHDRIGKMLHNICISAVVMSLRWASRGPWASCFILFTGSNLVTHGQLLCKEISGANIQTWVARAKKVAISGGLSTIWGSCRLEVHYFKNWRMLYSAEINTLQPSIKIYVKNIATVPGICFILATITPNLMPFWMIYTLKLMFSSISASCVKTWIGHTPTFGIRITIITMQTINATNKNGKMLKL